MDRACWRTNRQDDGPIRVGPSSYQNTVSRARGNTVYNQSQRHAPISSSRAPNQTSRDRAKSQWNPDRPEVVFNDHKDYLMPYEFERGSKYFLRSSLLIPSRANS